jgi:hypothetical protein
MMPASKWHHSLRGGQCSITTIIRLPIKDSAMETHVELIIFMIHLCRERIDRFIDQ